MKATKIRIRWEYYGIIIVELTKQNTLFWVTMLMYVKKTIENIHKKNQIHNNITWYWQNSMAYSVIFFYIWFEFLTYYVEYCQSQGTR
jgi:hypothetical protein